MNMQRLNSDDISRLTKAVRILIAHSSDCARRGIRLLQDGRAGAPHALVARRLQLLYDEVSQQIALTQEDHAVIGTLIVDLLSLAAPSRDKSVRIRMTPDEYCALAANAESAGLGIGQYVRQRCCHCAATGRAPGVEYQHLQTDVPSIYWRQHLL